jgi:hypothetical protein
VVEYSVLFPKMVIARFVMFFSIIDGEVSKTPRGEHRRIAAPPQPLGMKESHVASAYGG